MMFDVNTYIGIFKGLTPFEQILGIFGIVILNILRKKSDDKRIRNIVQNEKAITHIEDSAIYKEKAKVKTRVKDLLASIKSTLYESMEGFVYSDEVNSSRRITLIRKKTKINITAAKFLDDHYDALKEVLMHVILPETIEWMDDYNVAEMYPCCEDINNSAVELRNRLFSEIRSRTGTNVETRAVEDSILTHGLVVSFLESSYSYSQQMRNERKNYVENETKKYRVQVSTKLIYPRKK